MPVRIEIDKGAVQRLGRQMVAAVAPQIKAAVERVQRSSAGKSEDQLLRELQSALPDAETSLLRKMAADMAAGRRVEIRTQ